MSMTPNLPPVSTQPAWTGTPGTEPEQPKHHHTHAHASPNKALARRRPPRANANGADPEHEHPELEELAVLAEHHPQARRKRRRSSSQDADSAEESGSLYEENEEQLLNKEQREALRDLVIEVSSQQNQNSNEQHEGDTSKRARAHDLNQPVNATRRADQQTSAQRGTPVRRETQMRQLGAPTAMMELQRLLRANGARRPGDKLAWQALAVSRDHIAHLLAHPGEKDKKATLAALAPWLKSISGTVSPGFQPSPAQASFYLLFPLRPLQMLAPRLRSQLGMALASSNTLCVQHGPVSQTAQGVRE